MDESTPLKSLKEIEEEREAEKKREQRFVRFLNTLTLFIMVAKFIGINNKLQLKILFH